jgi:CRP-like cAMP-binding protein
MNTSNQDKTDHSTTYDPNVALEFFKLVGKLESVKEGNKFFVQGKTGLLPFLQTNKIYLLMEGSVAVHTANGSVLNMESGEIFGEYTPYSLFNASATASTPCELFSIDEKQFLIGLKKKPEFLFMLMDLLVKYLQKVGIEEDSKVKYSLSPLEDKNAKKGIILSSKMLNDLKQILGDEALTVVPESRVIFQQGAIASLMYVIVEGSALIIVGNQVVNRNSVGDMIGEIGLVSHHARSASVVAETRCSLLAINRQSLTGLLEVLPAFGLSLLRVLTARLSVHH